MSEAIEKIRAELQQACWKAIAELDAKRPDKAEDILLKALGFLVKHKDDAIIRLQLENMFLKKRLLGDSKRQPTKHNPKEKSHANRTENRGQEVESHPPAAGA